MDRLKRLSEVARLALAKLKHNPAETFLLFGGIIVLVVVARDVYVVIFKGYVWKPGSGFASKTLWEWLELALIPIVLTVGAILFNWSERRSESEIEVDSQRETALQAYFDRMSELLIDKGLRGNKESQNVARARTLAVLRKLDGNRKRAVIQFLDESELIVGESPVVDLTTADLENADLSEAGLQKANFKKVFLYKAKLRRSRLNNAILTGAILVDANLTKTNLSEAKLDGANLYNADLTDANLNQATLDKSFLKGAKITDEQLAQAKSLKGATMPNGTVHE